MRLHFPALCFRFVLGWLLWLPLPLSAQSIPDFQVYVFLGENCLISRHYTPLLRELHRQYADHGVEFVGLFPNGYSTQAGIEAFQTKFEVPFPLHRDSTQAITRRFGVTVTPEVVIWDVKSKVVRYQGRIDNQYARVGRRRLKPTTHELSEALAALAQGEPVPLQAAPPVGCLITQIATCE